MPAGWKTERAANRSTALLPERRSDVGQDTLRTALLKRLRRRDSNPGRCVTCLPRRRLNKVCWARSVRRHVAASAERSSRIHAAAGILRVSETVSLLRSLFRSVQSGSTWHDEHSAGFYF